tara:strand:+ start:213 stop:371 length:159 start_codon:yes stop_codon:yes gene_type:complete
MIKYVAVGMIAYMIFAGLFSVKVGEEVGIGFNPSKVVTRFVSDIESLVENVR